MKKKLNSLISCNFNVDVCGIATNSQEVEPGFLFVCIMGNKTDRHDYIEDAIENGAAAVVGTRSDVDCRVPYIQVDDIQSALYELCTNFYDDPLSKLKIIAITGTDGKTSTAWIISNLVGQDRCAYMGTHGIYYAGMEEHALNTCPAYEYFMYFAKHIVDAGCEYLCMEASSEAQLFGRLDHIEFRTTAYTNINREHLNNHRTIENYIACKMAILEKASVNGKVILNADDEHFEEASDIACGKVYSYGTKNFCDLQILDFAETVYNTPVVFKILGEERKFVSPLLGSFNVENLACALLVCLAEGFELNDLLAKVPQLSIPGRMQEVDFGQDFKVIIDFAHTINGVKQLLDFVKNFEHKRIIVAMGLPGDRDGSNRPIIGKLLEEGTDYTFITSDDNSTEDPYQIAEDILACVDNRNMFFIEPTRSKAVKQALDFCKPGDLLLILGKGSDIYIRTPKGRIDYNDYQEVKKYFAK
ncbi:MAG: UDP-N-acetylmuramoyl-L-alanyl-D-glutamate--2,6-diaminopimelate ligase [Eggerthellaceae bacterium]|nr:UDP-N-acetylmuramoyl-L-alanyl-D-glutamate--2,6-diaminopimelate ligase [Eggerthellaceae bacterium]